MGNCTGLFINSKMVIIRNTSFNYYSPIMGTILTEENIPMEGIITHVAGIIVLIEGIIVLIGEIVVLINT